ncbi:hypothetical protein P7K49_001655 [Saguinus oedipus]|uniref:Uncharacterized protein n=1 Tax=Saguinus oedipus TaxID=9490 RepID=A0ABQ9WF34_SAGOE|nr:hypothetical protein P7K49_001655 [Saguinus oedipus]
MGPGRLGPRPPPSPPPPQVNNLIWHVRCLECSQNSCYIKNKEIFCKMDYFSTVPAAGPGRFQRPRLGRVVSGFRASASRVPQRGLSGANPELQAARRCLHRFAPRIWRLGGALTSLALARTHSDPSRRLAASPVRSGFGFQTYSDASHTGVSRRLDAELGSGLLPWL